MESFSTPGVIVKEIPSLPRSVVPVATAIPAFIGYTEKAGLADNAMDLKGKPVRIRSLLEYNMYFGGAPKQDFEIEIGPTQQIVMDNNVSPPEMLDTIPLPFQVNKISFPKDPTDPTLELISPFRMFHAVSMFFANGGGPCYIVSVNNYREEGETINRTIDRNELGNTTTPDTIPQGGLEIIKRIDEVTLLVFPDADGLSVSDYYGLYQDAMFQCDELKDRFTLIDVKQNRLQGNVTDSEEDSSLPPSPPQALYNGLIANLNYGAAYHPWLNTTLAYNWDETCIKIVQRNENGSGTGEFDGKMVSEIDGDADDRKSQLLAQIRNGINNIPVLMPPSSTMAGIYARVDVNRGVFKAPANEGVFNVISLTGDPVTDEEQGELNVPVNGKAINVIRSFTNRGILVWGARTLDGNSNEWRYVSVRRYFIFVEQSLKAATQPYVFEPNNQSTWGRIRGLISNFLDLQLRAGALQGSTPAQAYFVNIGLGETMTALDILEGRLIIEVGLAVVRPAEFIILKFSHKLPEA